MVNGPEVWTRPGIDDGLTHGWLFSSVLLAYLLYQWYLSGNFQKIPAFYFSDKVTTLVLSIIH